MTGDEPMTGAQGSYLQTLSQEAGEDFDESSRRPRRPSASTSCRRRRAAAAAPRAARARDTPSLSESAPPPTTPLPRAARWAWAVDGCCSPAASWSSPSWRARPARRGRRAGLDPRAAVGAGLGAGRRRGPRRPAAALPPLALRRPRRGGGPRPRRPHRRADGRPRRPVQHVETRRTVVSQLFGLAAVRVHTAAGSTAIPYLTEFEAARSATGSRDWRASPMSSGRRRTHPPTSSSDARRAARPARAVRHRHPAQRAQRRPGRRAPAGARGRRRLDVHRLRALAGDDLRGGGVGH